MKLGFVNHPKKNSLEEIEWVGRNGFDYIDLFLEENNEKFGAGYIRKIKAKLDEFGIGVVGHTAWYLPIGSPIRLVREAAIKDTIRFFAIFKKLGAEKVTVHANWPPSVIFSCEEAIAFQIESLHALVNAAKKYKLKVMYEPTETIFDSVDNVDKVLSSVNGLFLNLDVGHANCCGRTLKGFFDRFSEKIIHVHVSDNDGLKDSHLSLGEGSIDWRGVFKRLKKFYDGTITIEIFPQDKNVVLKNRDFIKKCWNA